jgi:cytoskeletal protein CcmA (bactofilin family)
MWKRDEAVRPTSGPPVAPLPSSAPNVAASPSTRTDAGPSMEKDIVNIGKSVVIKGELNGSEDLTIEGHVEGTIQLREHVLTIGPNGKIKAQVFAKSVVVLGEVHGNITASDKVDIRDNGSVEGDLMAPRIAIAEGAHFKGSVDMQRKGPAPQPQAKPAASPQAAAPQPQQAPAPAQPGAPQAPRVGV